MLYNTKKSIKIAEIIFDIVYISVVLFLAIFILSKTDSFGTPYWMFGLITLILIIGDCFHLIPRIIMMWYENAKLKIALGMGKMITSVTMTLFYFGLWCIGILTFKLNTTIWTVLTLVVFIFAFVRILLCLLPQNKWVTDEASTNWILLRNAPFIIVGIIVTIQYAICGIAENASVIANQGPAFLWIVIVVSFVFYIPVLFLAKKHPKIGMLMIPKSCAYVVMIIMGLSFPCS